MKEITYMTFLELANKRYSARKYKDQPIEKEKLDQVLEAGRIAPTAKNNQPVKIYVLQSKEALEKISTLTPCAFNAPCVLMFAYDETLEWTHPDEEGIHSGVEDCSIVASHVMLEATDLGLETCWVNRFPNTKTAQAFQLSDTMKPVLLMPIGYADDEPSIRHTQRKDMKEIVEYL